MRDFQQTHILYEDGIDAGVIKLLKQKSNLRQLIVMQQRVHRSVDFSIENVGIATELSDIVDTIACCSTCAKLRWADVDSICTVVDGGLATLQILCWGQQFQHSHNCYFK